MERPMKYYRKIAHKRSNELIFNALFLGSL